jgi:hypothetical protein
MSLSHDREIMGSDTLELKKYIMSMLKNCHDRPHICLGGVEASPKHALQVGNRRIINRALSTKSNSFLERIAY